MDYWLQYRRSLLTGSGLGFLLGAYIIVTDYHLTDQIKVLILLGLITQPLEVISLSTTVFAMMWLSHCLGY